MTSGERDGGAAFPEVFTGEKWSESHRNFKRDTYSAGGMSLRDYFAAAALAGYRHAEYRWYATATGKGEFCDPQKVSEWAYADADAMLAERAK